MMRTVTVVVSLSALAVLSGCSGKASSPTATTIPATSPTGPASTTTSSTRSASMVEAALLVPADVPGSTVATSPDAIPDYSACFPDNPMGAEGYPGEVKSPDLELIEGDIVNYFRSRARQGTPEQARELVDTFASEVGSTCIFNAFKAALTTSSPARTDLSGLKGTPRSISVGDGGAVLSIAGIIKRADETVEARFGVLAFRKGSLVVLVDVDGPDAVELAQKIAGRLA